MKKQKPNTRHESWEVNDNSNPSTWRKFAKNMVSRIVRRTSKKEIQKEFDDLEGY